MCYICPSVDDIFRQLLAADFEAIDFLFIMKSEPNSFRLFSDNKGASTDGSVCLAYEPVLGSRLVETTTTIEITYVSQIQNLFLSIKSHQIGA